MSVCHLISVLAGRVHYVSIAASLYNHGSGLHLYIMPTLHCYVNTGRIHVKSIARLAEQTQGLYRSSGFLSYEYMGIGRCK